MVKVYERLRTLLLVEMFVAWSKEWMNCKLSFVLKQFLFFFWKHRVRLNKKVEFLCKCKTFYFSECEFYKHKLYYAEVWSWPSGKSCCCNCTSIQAWCWFWLESLCGRWIQAQFPSWEKQWCRICAIKRPSKSKTIAYQIDLLNAKQFRWFCLIWDVYW